MSWISANYEKAAVAGAILVAAALGYSGLQSKNAVEVDFKEVPEGRGNDDPSVKDGDKVATAKSSLQIKQQWTQGEVDGRPVDLFTGVPLFVRKDSKTPVDLPKSSDIHPPVTNQWWMDNRIDPGFGDSPQRDEDNDGFTNLEEFNAKTDPTDNRSHPNLIQKLAFVKSESVEWVLRPNGFPDAAQPTLNFEYNDTNKNAARNDAGNPIKVNDLFFSEGVVKDRFKLLGFDMKKVKDDRIDAEVEEIIIRIEDLKPNKKGTIYEIPANFRRADARKFSKFDHTAVLSLEALGFNGQEFKVEELTDFALPAGSEKKRYRLMEVHSDRIVVRETLEDGKTQNHEISKRP
ncbi:MAG: Amuc_1099 family pilus-like system protein [Verrucomicrobiota bacterium]